MPGPPLPLPKRILAWCDALSLRMQLMLVFAVLSISATVITTLTLTTLNAHRLGTNLQGKATQYARQLQRDWSAPSSDVHLSARTLLASLMEDHDVDGVGVYTVDGGLMEGRGIRPDTLRISERRPGLDSGHLVTVVDFESSDGERGWVYVSLSTAAVDALRRHDISVGMTIAAGVLLCSLLLAVRVTRLPGERLGIAERERLETLVSERTRDLEQSREMFRLTAESTKAIPFAINVNDGSFLYVGAQSITDTGIPEEQWKESGALDLVAPRSSNPDLRRSFDECPAGPFEFHATLTRVNGQRLQTRWTGTCEITAEARFIRGLMHDVTDMYRLEQELAAAQKLESVGRLAAGVAHEINTPVQFVCDNVEFVRSSLSDINAVIAAYRTLQGTVQSGGDVATAARAAADAEASADLDYLIENVPMAVDSAVEGLGRIATIVRSMKEFAYPDQAQKTFVDLNHAIQSTLVVAHNEYKYIAELETDFGVLPPIACYVGEINQVVLNLLVNASHAIADAVKGTPALGKITLRTRADAGEVELSIADTGTGIPETVRDKIFDPFFTTKEVGKGTGQGLAIAHNVIVNKHGGSLRFETQAGQGTTFFIRLPIESVAA